MPVEIEGRFYKTVCSGTPDGKTPRGHRVRIRKILGDSPDFVLISPWITPELLPEYPVTGKSESDGICPDCWPKDDLSIPHPDLEIYKMMGMPYKEGPYQGIVDVIYQASERPPYKWRVLALGEDEQKMVLLEKEGSWVEAMFKAQELKKVLGIKGLKEEDKNG